MANFQAEESRFFKHHYSTHWKNTGIMKREIER
jgi:hypothetical protein